MAGLFDRLQDEIARRDPQSGISPLDLLDMSPELQGVLQLLARRGALPASDVAAALSLPEAEATSLLDDLVAKGHAGTEVVDGVNLFRAQFGRRRARTVPEGIWQALTDKVEPKADEPKADEP